MKGERDREPDEVWTAACGVGGVLSSTTALPP